MNNIRYNKILNFLCDYYGININDFPKTMNKKENKYMFLLLLKRNDSFVLDKVCEKIGTKNISNIKKNIKIAEVKLLINKEFRDKYFEIECDLRRELKIIK